MQKSSHFDVIKQKCWSQIKREVSNSCSNEFQINEREANNSCSNEFQVKRAKQRIRSTSNNEKLIFRDDFVFVLDCVSNEIIDEVANKESEENSSSNDFFDVFDCASNVIVDEYNSTDNARILEFDSWDDWAETYSRIWSKISNDDDFRCLNSFIVKQWRRLSMFELVHCCKFRAIQVRQKLVTFDMSRRHWHDEKRILWHDNYLYVSSNLIEKTSFVQNNSLIEHLMWNAF